MALPTALAQRKRRNPSGFVYDGFISYSHAVDRESAKGLQRILHRLGRPWYRRAALRVFRDDTALAASSNLAAAIKDALRESRTFVLLASPESAASTWVQQEVAFWRSERSAKTFFIVLTDGALVWDDDTGDFDWDRTTALPKRQLSGWFGQEPLWVDLRGNREQRRRREFRSAAATVAAAIHGVPKDDLFSEDARQQRRLVAVLSALLVLVLVGASLAVWQWNTATTQRDRADQQARTALSRALAAESLVNDTADARLAAQLALAAYGVAPTSEAVGAVLHELDRNRHVLAYVRRGTDQISTQLAASSPTPAKVAITADGSTLAYSDEGDPVVTLWDTRTERSIGAFRTAASGQSNYTLGYGLAFSADGRTLIADDGTDLIVWDVRSGRSRTISGAGGGLESVVSPDGRWVAQADDPHRRGDPIRLWRTDTGAQVSPPASSTDLADNDLAFDPTGQRLYAEHRDGIDVLDLATMTWSNAVPLRTVDHPEPFALDPSGTRLVVAAGSDIELWDPQNGRALAAAAPADASGVTAIGLSDNARTVVAGNEAGKVIAIDLGTGQTTELATQRARIEDLAVAADSTKVAAISVNGDITVSSPNTDHRLLTTVGPRSTDPRSATTAAAVSQHGGVAVTARSSGTDIWSLNGPRLVTEASGLTVNPSSDVVGAAVNADGTRVAELSAGRLTLADAHSGAVLAKTAVSNTTEVLEGGGGVHFLPDGRRVMVDADGGPEVIDVRGGTPEQKFPAQVGGGFAANADGSVIAVVTQAETPVAGGSIIQVWRWQGGTYDKVTQLTVSSEARDVAVSQDGSHVAVADIDGRVVVVGVAGDHPQQVLNTGGAGAHSRIAFTADGAMLIQADQQLGGLALWGVADGQLLTTWQASLGDTGSTSSDNVGLAVDADGRALTVQPDGSVLAWQTDINAARSSLCGIAGKLSGGNLTRYLQGAESPRDCP